MPESLLVGFSGYARLWADPRVRMVYVAAFFARIPQLSVPIVLTLVVVEKLDGTYTQAGLVVAAETLGAAIAAPWRGRLIDRLGLRRVLVPSIIAVALIYPVVAFASYTWLVPLAFLVGVFLIPIFTVVRLALAVMVEDEQRRTAFAADAIMAEASFIIGPAAGALLATQAGPGIAIAAVGVCQMIGGLMFFWVNPPMRRVKPNEPTGPTMAGRWLTAPVMFVFLVSAGTVIALAGTDLAIIAELRELDSVGSIALVFLFWGVGSLVGGLIYGALPMSIRPTHLLLALGLLTIPVGFGSTVWSLTLWVVPAGVMCAPAMTAASEALTRLVPEDRRGEAMGWQGTAFMFGAAASPPFIGASIDAVGAWGGFAVGGAIAVAFALFSYGEQLVPRFGTKLVSQPVR
ncbi:MFS transporter [Aeromicrobium sp.]|uniref:MFS transporter n=1 Tax=Aeromicrobium sp. TaxID=1871063 RepID=UPI003D6C3019